RRTLGRLQHRAPIRAGCEPVRRYARELPLLFCAQDDVREVLQRVRHLSRRIRHARRDVRGDTLIQTGKIYQFPVILFGRAYWAGLVRWLQSKVLVERKISPTDLDLLILTD